MAPALGPFGAFDIAYARIAHAPIEKLVACSTRMGRSSSR
jgi:predicted dithiol-disulfide oxidoreductase (DUF899 family)